MSHVSFAKVFEERVAAIEARAKAVGLNFTSICQQAGISRATPDRWKRQTPKTIRLVTEMERIVADKEKEVATAGGGATNV